MADETKKGFELKAVQDAVKAVMKPNVAKVLAQQGVEMEAALPEIYNNMVPGQNESVDSYALRCVNAALCQQMSQNFQEQVVERLGRKGKVVSVDTPVDKAYRKEELKEEEQSAEDLDLLEKLARAIKKLSFKQYSELFNELKTLVVSQKDGSIDLISLEQGDINHASKYFTTIGEKFSEALKQDGINASPLNAEDKSKEAIDAITTAQVGFDDYKAKFMSTLEKYPELAAQMNKQNIDIDEVCRSVFATCRKSDKESDAAYMKRTIELGIADASLKAKDGQGVIGRLKQLEKENKVNENKDGESKNNLMSSLSQIVKFPYTFMKTILSGKSPEEIKAEEDNVNKKIVDPTVKDLSRVGQNKKLDDELAVVHQYKIDKLIGELNTLDFTDTLSVFKWMREYQKASIAISFIPERDKEAMKKTLKEKGIELDVKEEKPFSYEADSVKEEDTQIIAIRHGMKQIYNGGKFDGNISKYLDEILPEPKSKYQEELEKMGIKEEKGSKPEIQPEEKSEVQTETQTPVKENETLDPDKKAATRAITEETLESGRGNPDGKNIVHEMDLTLNPEKAEAERLEEERRKAEEEEREDEEEPHGPPTERGRRNNSR